SLSRLQHRFGGLLAAILHQEQSIIHGWLESHFGGSLLSMSTVAYLQGLPDLELGQVVLKLLAFFKRGTVDIQDDVLPVQGCLVGGTSYSWITEQASSQPIGIHGQGTSKIGLFPILFQMYPNGFQKGPKVGHAALVYVVVEESISKGIPSVAVQGLLKVVY